MKSITCCIFLILLGLSSTLFLPVRSSLAGGNCDKAREIYQNAVATSDYHQKAELYQRAIDLCPDYPEAHNNLADAFEHLAKYEEAIAEYRQAITLNPDLAVAYFGMGDSYLKIGLFEKASEAYEAGLKLKPTDHLAKVGLEIARRGVPSVAGTEIIDSITIIDKLKDTTVKTMGPGGVRRRISRIRFHNIFFDFDSSDVKPSSIPQLQEIGKAVSSRAFQRKHFVIEGHTDNIGTDEYNTNLSRKRAESVQFYLMKNFNVPNAFLKVKGYGEMRPIGKNTSREGRRQNRRVEVVAIHQ